MSRKWWVFLTVACGTFMATLDSSIVNIALSTITKDLASDLQHTKWIIIIYFLIITCFLLPFGKLSDQYGHKKIFGLGFLIFTVGSAMCSFSQTLTQLVSFRVLQALGASMLMANGPAIITSSFPAKERGVALGNLAMVVSVGLISGPSLGGMLIVHLGWRSIFFLNIPFGILGLILAAKYVEKDEKITQSFPFDWLGAILQFAILFGLISVFDIHRIPFLNANSFRHVDKFLLITVFCLVALFIKVESKHKAPLFDLSLMKDTTYWSANLAAFFTFVSYSAIAVLMPFFLEEVLKFHTDKAGFFMTAIPITIFLVAPLSGHLSDRLGSKGLCILGTSVLTLVLFMMGGLIGPGLNENISHFAITASLCMVGLSIALFQSPNNNAIMSAVPKHKLGVASAFMATIRNLGLVMGSCLATTLFTLKLGSTGSQVAATQSSFLVAAFIGLLAIFSCFGKRSGPHWK